MASPPRSRYSDLSPRYNRILLQIQFSRDIARRSSDRYKSTLVGSLASGVDIEESDGDILIEPINITIDESSLRYRPDLPCYVRISTEGLEGLVPNIILGDGQYMLADPVRSMCEEIFGEIKLFGKESGFSKVGRIHINYRMPSDMVPQLRIGGIPQIVRSFATRDRLWPSDDIISLISTGEFHLVARPAPLRPDPKHDFCLSFAKAEVVVLRTMSVNQIATMRLLKLIGRAIDFDRGVLTSYHLKTSALWHFEKTDARFWENHLPLVDILKRLDKYLHDRFLPHYFVPDMNLVSDVSESDLIYIRRRIWSLLGLCLITDDITGTIQRTRLAIADSIFYYLSTQQSLPEQHPDYVSNSRNIVETAEVMYGTGIVSYNVMKQRLSVSVNMICPDLVVDEEETFQRILTSCQESIVRWIYFRQQSLVTYGYFVDYISVILDSNTDTLEELFMIKSTIKNKRGRHAGRRELRESEILMNKWISFTDDFIVKLLQYIGANQVLRAVLLNARDDSRVINNQCEEYIDSMFNNIYAFAVGHINVFSYHLANDNFPIRSVPVGDSLVDFLILYDVIESLYINVEYALVTSARIKASPRSADQTGRIMRTMNKESIEYRCYSAYFAFKTVMQEIHNLCMFIDSTQGVMKFMAATLRREQCS